MRSDAKFCKIKTLFLCLVSISLLAASSLQAQSNAPLDPPPALPREFRAAWVATVANIDWPSKRDLSAREQREEMVKILDQAAALKLNAIILQIRPSGDAFYRSRYEPWSEFLTGKQGQAPEDNYDPLAFAIEQAHRRGIQLHAWFNPYRVRHGSSRSENHASHIANRRPDLVKTYGNLLWLDPGEPDAQRFSRQVIMDVVKRYDLDGIHFDDYFYPYPRSENGKRIPFPDDPSWQKYQANDGKLSRDDWRRENVNQFIKDIYREVKGEKPEILVGISPFGIYRPGYPSYARGMDQYASLYADPLLWLQEGWLDYIAPQLYWEIAKPDQSFIGLFIWWRDNNPKGRHLWPGLFTSRLLDSKTSFTNEEIAYQIEWSRHLAQTPPGHIHFSMKAIMPDRVDGLNDVLLRRAYRNTALPPATPWLNVDASNPVNAEVDKITDTTVEVRRRGRIDRDAKLWVVQVQRNNRWYHSIVPAEENETTISTGSRASGEAGQVKQVIVYTTNQAVELSSPRQLRIPRH